MTRVHLIGLLSGLLLSLPLIWLGQRQVNPQAQMLLWPEPLAAVR